MYVCWCCASQGTKHTLQRTIVQPSAYVCMHTLQASLEIGASQGAAHSYVGTFTIYESYVYVMFA